MTLKRLAILLVGGFVLSGIALGAYLDVTEEKARPPEQAAQESDSATSSALSDALPVDPFQRIISIVGSYEEYPDISNLNDFNAKNPQPPFDVIVVMDHVQGCVTAKQKAQQIMRDLYHDPVTAPTLLRVKAINAEFVSASLGREGAQKMDESHWKDGPSNFIRLLQSVADYDMDMQEEATSSTVQGYTYAELGRGCE